MKSDNENNFETISLNSEGKWTLIDECKDFNP